jgi:hypothetical protein
MNQMILLVIDGGRWSWRWDRPIRPVALSRVRLFCLRWEKYEVSFLSNPLAPDALGRPVPLPIRTICAFRTGVDTVI